MGETRRKAAVVIVDGLKLRRAQVEAFLQPWCLREGLELEAIDPDDIAMMEMPAMVVLSIGETSFQGMDLLQVVDDIRQAAPETPITVLSDIEQAANVVTAFEAGVRGYIPTTTDPDIALDALSFILNGGHYFPSPALAMPIEETGDNGSRL